LLPFAVKVKPAPPAAADEGKIEATVGAGVSTAKESSAEVPPPGPGVNTEMAAFCPVAISTGVMVVESWVALAYVVVRLLPFHWITDEVRKALPLTVSVNAVPPALAEEGETEVTAGTGALTARVTADDVPPPGAGFITVTDAFCPTAMFAAEIVVESCVALMNEVV